MTTKSNFVITLCLSPLIRWWWNLVTASRSGPCDQLWTRLQACTTSLAPFCICHNHYVLAWIFSWKPSELNLWVWCTATWACRLLSPTCSWLQQKRFIHLSQFPASSLKASSRISGQLLISTAKFRWKPWNKKQSCLLHQCSMWHFHWNNYLNRHLQQIKTDSQHCSDYSQKEEHEVNLI